MKKIILCTLSTLLLSTTIQAESLSNTDRAFNKLGLNIETHDQIINSEEDQSKEVFYYKGLDDFSENLYATGSYIDNDVIGLNTGFDTVKFGLGYVHFATPSIALYSQLQYVRSEPSYGTEIEVGMKHFIGDLELNVSVSDKFLKEQDETDAVVSLGGRYYIGKNFSIQAKYNSFEADSWEAGVTYHF